MAKRTSEPKPDRYFQVHKYMMDCDAWKALSAAATRLYLQIGHRYNGVNNGRISFSCREAAAECNLNRNTANKAFKELVEYGFIEETRHGGLSRKTRIASEWRLTAFRCDLTHSPASRLFMQRGQRAREARAMRSRPQTERRPKLAIVPKASPTTH